MLQHIGVDGQRDRGQRAGVGHKVVRTGGEVDGDIRGIQHARINPELIHGFIRSRIHEELRLAEVAEIVDDVGKVLSRNTQILRSQNTVDVKFHVTRQWMNDGNDVNIALVVERASHIEIRFPTGRCSEG